METFVISDSTSFVCIGPVESALGASADLTAERAPPQCWSKAPTVSCGGTVLVNDVDMRVPVLPGQWCAEKLFNGSDNEYLAGGVVWHSEAVGDAAAAAALLKRLEDAGAPPICNVESAEVLRQGVRFIGRYSWGSGEVDDYNDSSNNNNNNNNYNNSTARHKHAWLSEEKSDALYEVFQGPHCFFAESNALSEVALPLLEDKLCALEANNKEEDEREDEEDEEGANDHANVENLAFVMPAVTNFAQKGVCFAFKHQEYLFGRLWFNEEGLCIAFVCYTYAMPEYFAFTRVGDHPVCPVLFPPREKDEKDKENDNGREDPLEKLARRLRIASQHDLRVAVQDMTLPLREAFLTSVVAKDTALCVRIFGGSEPILIVDEKIFTQLMRVSKWSSSSVNEDALLIVLQATPQEVLLRLGESEIKRFQDMHVTLCDLSYPFHSFNDRKYRLDAASVVAAHLDRPRLFAALLARGFPVRSTLAATESDEWPRTTLAEAALRGETALVEALLDHGADVNESVGGDPWSAIVYAVASVNNDLLEVLRRRFPDHAVWTAKDIPVSMKLIPDRGLLSDSSKMDYDDDDDDEEEEADDEVVNLPPEAFQAALREKGTLGSLEEVIAKAKEEKEERDKAQRMRAFNPFAREATKRRIEDDGDEEDDESDVWENCDEDESADDEDGEGSND